ncbi:hypothetical protein AMJ40_06315 [candidate division TA06 bacterium DG_26]|uniref:Radical SAM core domain-containing protein n=1 Tax=candidate division TA06 bacterium DG_26 TaxID=1703771 RepID=A0A0S7WG32_UNCT6|nr:MAG: hypothetical protein AMJ40_06315 [candidate division TA06 bacterium DG_26]
MRFKGMIIRPPSEADSYLLQITYGCSHNKCTFCPTYLDKKFGVRPVEEVFEDLQLASSSFPQTRRVFLCDGNALVLQNRRLLPILERIGLAFPNLQRVGIYANARDILKRSMGELEELRDKKLGLIYMGLESGSEEILRRVKKGSTAREMIDSVKKAQRAGIKVSVIGLLGLGGKTLSHEHAVKTGKAVSEMDPLYFSLLSLMLVPGTELHAEWERGEFEMPEPIELLEEMKEIIENLEDLSGCIFRTNHASNYLPLAGRLPRDKQKLIAIIDRAISQGESALRPESWRGL